MNWRLAKSLEQLRSEVNERWPNRSKASDGAIGDTAHAASASDHNPNPQGVVCAFDLTHDPDNGVDCFALSEYIRTHRPPALKYIIFNRRICSARSGWEWRANTGHEKHMHVSVGVGSDGQSTGPYDDTTPWLEHFDVGDDFMDQEARDAFGYLKAQLDGIYEQNKFVSLQVSGVFNKLDPQAFAAAVIAKLPAGAIDRGAVEEAVKQALREGVGE